MKNVFSLLALVTFSVSGQWLNWDVHRVGMSEEWYLNGYFSTITGTQRNLLVADTVYGGTFYITIKQTSENEMGVVYEIDDSIGNVLGTCYTFAVKGDTARANMVVKVGPNHKKLMLKCYKPVPAGEPSGRWEMILTFVGNPVMPTTRTQNVLMSAKISSFKAKNAINCDVLGRKCSGAANRMMISNNKIYSRMR